MSELSPMLIFMSPEAFANVVGIDPKNWFKSAKNKVRFGRVNPTVAGNRTLNRLLVIEKIRNVVELRRNAPKTLFEDSSRTCRFESRPISAGIFPPRLFLDMLSI